LKKSFDNILEFTKLKEKCLFCRGPLRACLTNFIGYRKNGLPILNEPIENGRFVFFINHTTQNYDVQADVVIDAVNNKLILTLPEGSLTEELDQYVAIQAFDDLRPHIELSCINKFCKNQYYLSTSIFRIGNIFNNKWIISPPKLFLESFRTNSLLVQNDWLREETNIYFIANEDAEPIKVSLMDFEEMGSEKLLTRIQTYVVFG